MQYLEMENGTACKQCARLSDALDSWETCMIQGGPHLYLGRTNFFLGTSADLKTRMTKGCNSCRSMLASQDAAALVKKHGEVYGVSAHLRVKQPLLFLAWGNLPKWNEHAEYRGAQLVEFNLNMLHSMNPILSGTEVGCGRRYDLECYDIGLIRRWIDQCDRRHESTCSGKYEKFLLPTVKLSFIDVKDQCIVTPEDPVRYAALSYVWGSTPVPQATKANIESLRRPGALCSGTLGLPATIKDAIQLCSWIGIRYIWVDSMCIVQDDLESKMEQIQAMGSVYADAYLTIAAVTSETAGAGIPRISQPAVSTHCPKYLHLPGKTLIEGTQGSISIPPLLDNRSKWSTRGWTYQEMIFSKRLLVLSPVLSWSCCGAHWTEEFERASETSHAPPRIPETTLDKPSIAVWPSMREYSSLASMYAKRYLTMSSDTLNAFQGVMTPMSQWFPGNFLFATPEFTFDIGLLWQHRRRGGRPRAATNRSHAGHDFPSWSWISYQAYHLNTFWDADFQYPKPAMTVYPLVRWKKQEKATGDWSDVDNSYHKVRAHFGNPAAPIPEGWTKHFPDAEPPYYQHEQHGHVQPHPKFSYPIPPFQRLREIKVLEYYPHLLFEGDLLRVGFKVIGTPQKYDEINQKLQTDALVPEMDIYSVTDETWVGRIRLDLQPGSALPKYQEEQELIVISEATVQTNLEKNASLTWTELESQPEVAVDGLYRFVNVLWIGRTVDGKVYRKALGRVWHDALKRMHAERIVTLLT